MRCTERTKRYLHHVTLHDVTEEFALGCRLDSSILAPSKHLLLVWHIFASNRLVVALDLFCRRCHERCRVNGGHYLWHYHGIHQCTDYAQAQRCITRDVATYRRQLDLFAGKNVERVTEHAFGLVELQRAVGNTTQDFFT